MTRKRNTEYAGFPSIDLQSGRYNLQPKQKTQPKQTKGSKKKNDFSGVLSTPRKTIIKR